MKTVLVLSALLCAAFAALAENIEMAAEAAVEAPQEETAAEPAPVIEDPQQEVAAPEAHVNPCPEGWANYESRCFMVITRQKSWHSAKDHCNILGAHLASATTYGEYRFLQDLTYEARLSSAWLGGFNLESKWMWSDRDEFIYKNWHVQNPGSSYPCIYLHVNTGWTNNHCSSGYGFICSMRL